ncbi:hypothetical protein E1162_02925, partial [Rhodobacteraceae bacterium RKSG542]|uniref:GNAT family N-acetyltransferase n=1 Tax=Pseudovibrio flavus TaxID=2529854 RepID=UPI0012BBAAED
MKIVEVTAKDMQVYDNLLQAYEAEFSPLTKKKPDADGLFAKDVELGGDYKGYLLYVEGAPAGLSAIRCGPSSTFEVCDFYVLPIFRRGGTGRAFATWLFDQYKGDWEVKQIEGADRAIAFWRATIGDYTNSAYQEDTYEDAYWGTVTRQRFNNAV